MHTNEMIQKYKDTLLELGTIPLTYNRFFGRLNALATMKDSSELTPEERADFNKAYDKICESMRIIHETASYLPAKKADESPSTD